MYVHIYATSKWCDNPLFMAAFLRTMCEMAYQMLVKWRETGEGRSALIRVLDQHNCESNAEFLKTGEVDHYWK